ncbi:GFA family protein [Ruegeria atlantica]|uniref:GFA family protein n=1 Tax=Ruegeria atlantica TaxID=81569 RepID=UPI00071C9C62
MTAWSLHTGGCLCGSVRFEAIPSAKNPHTCSCKMFQRHTGSLSTAWVEFPKSSVSWTGEGGQPSTYRSSANSSRAFCANCGSTIGAIDDQPTVALLVGCFDNTDRKDLVASAHSFQNHKPSWWEITTCPLNEKTK